VNTYATSEYVSSVDTANLVSSLSYNFGCKSRKWVENGRTYCENGTESTSVNSATFVDLWCNKSWWLRNSAFLEMKIQLGGTDGPYVITTNLWRDLCANCCRVIVLTSWREPVSVAREDATTLPSRRYRWVPSSCVSVPFSTACAGSAVHSICSVSEGDEMRLHFNCRNLGNISICIHSCCSHLRHRASVKRFVSRQFLNLRQSVGFLGPGISPTQGRYLHRTTQTE
jgi:hypothetical protein